MIKLDLGGPEDIRNILTVLRSISAHLEALVDLKKRELQAVGVAVSDAEIDVQSEVLYTSDEQDYTREQRAKVLGRMRDLEDDYQGYHEGIDDHPVVAGWGDREAFGSGPDGAYSG